MIMNVNDRVALQVGRLNISVLEHAAQLDGQNDMLVRAWEALAAAAKAGATPDLEKFKAAEPQFATWLEQQKP